MTARRVSSKLLNGLSRLLAAAALAAGSLAAHAGPVSGQGTWETTLQARDLNGDSVIDAYYDTALDITWLADWNANGTLMNWTDANTWAAGLDVDGVTGWRLPTALNQDGTGPCGPALNCTDSEMGYMWYTELGNTAFFLTNTGDFTNLQTNYYWSGTEYAPNTSKAWYFNTIVGYQNPNDKDFALYVVAVREAM